MNVSEIYKSIKEKLRDEVTLVAVSKRKSQQAIMELYNCGQKIFGENQVQELVKKHEDLPKDIEWHMIGHLQTNKVKYIAPFISLIHAVDSLKLLETINKEAKKNKRIINCLFQFHIASEETKFGLTIDKINDILRSKEYSEIQAENTETGARIIGVMGMATHTDDKELIKKEFRNLKDYFVEIKANYFSEHQTFKEISTGMSEDYLLAIEEGSTMVRIGSLIFGHRT